MTDNEIIKALEEYLQKCQNIKYGARQKILVDSDFLKDALNLINRQKAEIERKEKLIAEMADYHQKFKAAAKNREKAVVRSVEKAANKEIERLHEVINGFEEQSHKDLMDFMNLSEKYQNAKSEAIKEFAERLKEEYSDFDELNEVIRYDNLIYAIDNLVKEMTEKDDD